MTISLPQPQNLIRWKLTVDMDQDVEILSARTSDAAMFITGPKSFILQNLANTDLKASSANITVM